MFRLKLNKYWENYICFGLDRMDIVMRDMSGCVVHVHLQVYIYIYIVVGVSICKIKWCDVIGSFLNVFRVKRLSIIIWWCGGV